MHINLKKLRYKALRRLRLWPLSLEQKCRITFGAAVLFVLALALLLPYIWMSQLTKKAALDAGRAKVETLLARHFQTKDAAEQTRLPPLDITGAVLDANSPQVVWIQLKKENESKLQALTDQQKEMVELLKHQEDRDDAILLTRKAGALYSDYVRVVKATEKCIGCHNPQGSAGAFARHEPTGVVVIRKPASEFSRTMFLNRVWVIAAGLIAGVGAIVAFYIVTQQIILRPIRQLRAIANNVAEGNLDTRSAIKTGDEFEKLAHAFNHMLDRLQASQEKLRQANKQLDDKIAQLSERNIELFKANKVKSEFLANISHEFRTPLNAILGFAEIIREKPDLIEKEKGRRYAENIIEGGKRLLSMINDLLDIAKTEAGRMQLHIEKASVPELCKSVVGQFAALTKKKKIKIRLSADGSLPELVTDAGKVQQILYNFLSNAVKYTPEQGRIEIRAEMVDEKNVRIAVTDTGCGIAEADKEKIFDKFRQADGSLTRHSSGTGLGLAICRELAALLAGNIGLESELGKGSTFWLSIPVTLTKDQNQSA